MPAPPSSGFARLFDGQLSCLAAVLCLPPKGLSREEASRSVDHRPPLHEGIDHDEPIVFKSLSRRSGSNVLFAWAMRDDPVGRDRRWRRSAILLEDEGKDRSCG
jgi:hypothetical protein